MSKPTVYKRMRIYHRYLGFFLAGIMAVYSISGIVMIFRDTNFLKSAKVVEQTLPKDISTDGLGKELRMRDFKVNKEENGVIFFDNGTFDRRTGIARFTKMELPFILGKMEKVHKANSKSPLFFMNVFFGLSLFFFVISSFWMFLPKTEIFKKGIYFTIGGIILMMVILFI